jgi:hypothetical protein
MRSALADVGVRDDGDADIEGTPLAQHAQRGSPANRRIGQQPIQLRWILNHLVVEGDDDITGTNASLVGLRAPQHLDHDSPRGVLDAKVIGEPRDDRKH